MSLGKIIGIALTFFVGWALICLTIFGLIIYATIHFILKFW